jgi:hypothetical protein
MHPVVYSATYEGEDRNRLTVFFRLLMIIPLAIVGFFYGVAAYVVTLIAWFALLITGEYPKALYDFNAGFVRFIGRVSGYYYLLTDEYPPFGGEPDSDYPIRVGIEAPLTEYSRLKVLFRIFLMIPVYILAYIMQLIQMVVAFVCWFVLLFTAELPEGLYKPLRASTSYTVKAMAYYLLLTEDFPPFWLEQEEEAKLLAPGGNTTIGAPDPPPPPARS